MAVDEGRVNISPDYSTVAGNKYVSRSETVIDHGEYDLEFQGDPGCYAIGNRDR